MPIFLFIAAFAANVCYADKESIPVESCLYFLFLDAVFFLHSMISHVTHDKKEKKNPELNYKLTCCFNSKLFE